MLRFNSDRREPQPSRKGGKPLKNHIVKRRNLFATTTLALAITVSGSAYAAEALELLAQVTTTQKAPKAIEEESTDKATKSCTEISQENKEGGCETGEAGPKTKEPAPKTEEGSAENRCVTVRRITPLLKRASN